MKDTYAKIRNLYPSRIMENKTLVSIGAGGAGEYIENMARSAVGEFILIDGDRVSAQNIATQNAYTDEVGEYKVNAVKNRILRINPKARVLAVNKFLDDSITDYDFEQIIGEKLFSSPSDILIAGCADDFYANARAARLALKYKTPYLQAGLYCRGLAGEISFSYPGVTPSCTRCATQERYFAYGKGNMPPVPSDGTPIFATGFLNSLKGFVSVMLLTYNSERGRYGGYLEKVKNRNFVQIKMDPSASDIGVLTFDKLLKENQNFFLGETVWIEQTPGNPENGYELCADCCGTGDLRNITINDTRKIWED